MAGTKYDSGKPRYELLDSAVLEHHRLQKYQLPSNESRRAIDVFFAVSRIADSLAASEVASAAVQALTELTASVDGTTWEKIAQVLSFGASKYEAHNWREGLEWSRILGAVMRHLAAHATGELCDLESGLPHVAHAGCGLMFLAAHAIHGYGVDDLYHPKQKLEQP